MFLQYFFKKENNQKIFSDNIYIDIVNQSKDILNKYDYFATKNYKSSFEIISIIIIFYLKIIKEIKIKDYKKINEIIIKNFISDLDKSLRENGIGDMSIGKYVKSYVKKFYYRLSKLDAILGSKNEKLDFIGFLDDLNIVKKDKLHLVYFKFINNYNEIKHSITIEKNKLKY